MSSRTIKNVGSGLIAQFWTGLIGLVALPVFARGLGAERYGLLALNLAVFNFAAVADLGVGRAASKYLAEDFERGEMHRTQRFISTALTVTLLMGLIGTLVLSGLTPLMVRLAFRIPPAMQREAELAFWITALGLLALLLRVLFDGVLAGHHRIAVLSFANMISATLRVGLSIAAILSGFSLLSVLIINVAVSYLHAAGLWLFTRRHFAGQIRIVTGWDWIAAKQLLTLGLVSTMSGIMANIVFLYADRFIIAVFLPLALTGYYTMAFDISSRQSYVSNSIAATFFPVFSGHGATSVRNLERSYIQASKAMAVGTTGLAMLLAVFARPLLTYWISPTFAANSTPSLAILAVAALLACYFQILYAIIVSASNQPGICVRVFAVAVAGHFALSLLLLRRWEIAGVATAFAAAYLVVWVYLLWWVSHYVVRVKMLTVLRKSFLGAWISAAGLGAILFLTVTPRLGSLVSVLAAFAGSYLLYLTCCSLIAYSREERSYVRDLLRNKFRSGWRKVPALAGDEP
jgi:O-antigen/teichoic acid export membrane protein